MNEANDYCEYSKWLREVAANAQHPFARDSESMVKYCLDWDTKMPRQYGWRFTDMESFRKQVEGIKDSVDQVNRVYWHDMARNIEAYGVMTFWRGGELLRSAIRSLNVHDILSPAVLSRSLLELSASLIENSNLIRKNVEQIKNSPDSGVIVSDGLEEFLVRIIWGTRLGNPPEFLKQRNILNCIQRCSKHPAASDLLPVYEFLCEVAHPNVIGNARFWGKVECLGVASLLFTSRWETGRPDWCPNVERKRLLQIVLCE